MSNAADYRKSFSIKKREDYSEVFKEIESLKGPQKFILLQGDLGSGKTYFVRYCLEQMGVPVSEMASPTFALIHRYSDSKSPIYHIDLYRVEDEADLESTGFWDLLQEKTALVFIEWSGKIEGRWWPIQSSVVELFFEKTLFVQSMNSQVAQALFEERSVQFTVLN